jgi:hypothetical protein
MQNFFRGKIGIIDPALMYCNTVWVPHPRDAFVARVGVHDANLLGRIKINKARLPWACAGHPE